MKRTLEISVRSRCSNSGVTASSPSGRSRSLADPLGPKESRHPFRAVGASRGSPGVAPGFSRWIVAGNDACGDSYDVETDAFGDGCMKYYFALQRRRMKAEEVPSGTERRRS